MNCFRERRGTILFETILFGLVGVVALGGAHFAVIRYWNRKMHALQKERLSYDGGKVWND